MKTMKAAVFHEYGLNVLHMEEVPIPVPGEGEVLLKVEAVAINDWDWQMLQGIPFVNRMINGMRKPRKTILGLDVAGSLYSLFSRKKFRTVMLQVNKSLSYINNLYETGKLKPVIDGPYPLDDLPAQMQRFGRGEHRGKIVIETEM
ncbi:MAG: zinc-binding dehydrogenase [Chitinispirillaceae bacterium]|nr:zinc-binding dehydrogenase [Chitinispirillaceae bacterium]